MNLKELRKELGISQIELSQAIGIDRARIANWEVGRGSPKTEDFKRLVQYFRSFKKFSNVDLDGFVASLSSQVKNDSLNWLESTPWAGVPIYDLPVAAGMAALIRDEKPSEPAYYLPIPGFKDCKFGARVSGDSMYPEIRNGDFVICKEVEDFIFGDIYLIITRDGQETVKYIHPNENPEFITLVPYNKSIPSTPIAKTSIVKVFKVKGVLKGY